MSNFIFHQRHGVDCTNMDQETSKHNTTEQKATSKHSVTEQKTSKNSLTEEKTTTFVDPSEKTEKKSILQTNKVIKQCARKGERVCYTDVENLVVRNKMTDTDGRPSSYNDQIAKTEDSVHSGESIYKNLSFEKVHNEIETQKCLAFWKRVMEKNLEPIRCTLIKATDESEQELATSTYEQKKPKSKIQKKSSPTVSPASPSTSFQKTETFKKIFEELKKKNLDKLKLKIKQNCKTCDLINSIDKGTVLSCDEKDATQLDTNLSEMAKSKSNTMTLKKQPQDLIPKKSDEESKQKVDTSEESKTVMKQENIHKESHSALREQSMNRQRQCSCQSDPCECKYDLADILKKLGKGPCCCGMAKCTCREHLYVPGDIAKLSQYKQIESTISQDKDQSKSEITNRSSEMTKSKITGSEVKTPTSCMKAEKCQSNDLEDHREIQCDNSCEDQKYVCFDECNKQGPQGINMQNDETMKPSVEIMTQDMTVTDNDNKKSDMYTASTKSDVLNSGKQSAIQTGQLSDVSKSQASLSKQKTATKSDIQASDKSSINQTRNMNKPSKQQTDDIKQSKNPSESPVKVDSVRQSKEKIGVSEKEFSCAKLFSSNASFTASNSISYFKCKCGFADCDCEDVFQDAVKLDKKMKKKKKCVCGCGHKKCLCEDAQSIADTIQKIEGSLSKTSLSRSKISLTRTKSPLKNRSSITRSNTSLTSTSEQHKEGILKNTSDQKLQNSSPQAQSKINEKLKHNICSCGFSDCDCSQIDVSSHFLKEQGSKIRISSEELKARFSSEIMQGDCACGFSDCDCGIPKAERNRKKPVKLHQLDSEKMHILQVLRDQVKKAEEQYITETPKDKRFASTGVQCSNIDADTVKERKYCLICGHYDCPCEIKKLIY